MVKRNSATQKSTPAWSADTVWAAAAAAQRINGEYINSRSYVARDDRTVAVWPNKELMLHLLSSDGVLPYNDFDPDTLAVLQQGITEQDQADGAAARGYWQLKLFAVLQGTATEFVKSAVAAANLDEITAGKGTSIGIIACLPQSYAKSMVRDRMDEIKQEAAFTSQHFGQTGQKIAGRLEVIDCVFSHKWLCYFVTATFDGNLVRFAIKNQQQPKLGKRYNFVAKVKAHREDNVTQLNYVRLTE